MKHIIIEGGDRLGKSTLIKGLADYYNFDNVTIRHFGKPPKEFPNDENPLDFQMKCFDKEAFLMREIRQLEKDVYNYYENILIWNRSHIGESVYGQMFRGQDPNIITDQLSFYEECYLLEHPEETYLITLTADPEFFFVQEDGNSFSKTFEDKKREIELFEKAHENSQLDNKFLIKVNDGDKYIPKDVILGRVLNFIAEVIKAYNNG